MTKTSAQRPRIAFRALSEEGKLNALRKWNPEYFGETTNERRAEYMAHWNAQDELQFMDDNSGRM